MQFFVLELTQLRVDVRIRELDVTLVRCVVVVCQLAVISFVDCVDALLVDCRD